jgi:microcompartment protein CcmL/EutN
MVMKNVKLILNEVKRLLGQDVNLESMKLEDGTTTIEYDMLEVGSPVFIVTEDENIPLPMGEYTLENGQVLAVMEDGVIGEIKEAAEQEVEASEETKDFATKEDLANAINEIKSMFSEHFKKEEPKKEELAKVEKVELSLEDDAPAAKAIKPNPEREVEKKPHVQFSKTRKPTTEDKMIGIISNLNLK